MTRLWMPVLKSGNTELSNEMAMTVARLCTIAGHVDLPHEPKIAMTASFDYNTIIVGGSTYGKQVLLKAVLGSDIHPGKVFTHPFS